MACVQCVICTELLTEECALMYLKCGHVYHQACLTRWFQTSKTCPDCRIAQNRVTITKQRLYLNFTNHPDVQALLAQQDLLTEQLRQSKVTIRDMKNTINIMDKTHADHIIENYQLEKDKSELTARLGQFRTEFVRANTELEKVNSEIEILKYELSVTNGDHEELANMQLENHQLKKDNADLTGRLDLFREEFLKSNRECETITSQMTDMRSILNNEISNLKAKLKNAEAKLQATRDGNVTMNTSNDDIHARMQQPHCIDYSSTQTNEQSDVCVKMNATQEMMTKRKNEETTNPQCANNPKRRQLKES